MAASSTSAAERFEATLRTLLNRNTEGLGANGDDCLACIRRGTSGWMVVLAIAWKLQEKVHGGLVGLTVAEVERNLILETLDHCLGNRTRAAHVLGISIRTLRNKLKQYTDEGIEVPLPRPAVG